MTTISQDINAYLLKVQEMKQRYLTRDVQILDRGDLAFICSDQQQVASLEGVLYLDSTGDYTQKTMDLTVLIHEEIPVEVELMKSKFSQFDGPQIEQIELGLVRDKQKLKKRSERLEFDLLLAPDAVSEERYDLPQYTRASSRRGETISDKKVSDLPFFDLASLFHPDKFRKRATFLRGMASHNSYGYVKYPGYSLLADDFLSKPIYQMTEYRNGSDRTVATLKFLETVREEKVCYNLFAGGGGEVKTIGRNFDVVVLVTTNDYDSRMVVKNKYAKLLPSVEVKYIHIDGLYKDIVSKPPLALLGLSVEEASKAVFIHNFFPELSHWSSFFSKTLCYYHLASDLPHEESSLPARMEDFDQDSLVISRFLVSHFGERKMMPVYDPVKGEVAIWCQHSGYRDRVMARKPSLTRRQKDVPIVDFLGDDATSGTKMRMLYSSSILKASCNGRKKFVDKESVIDITTDNLPRFYFPALDLHKVEHTGEHLLTHSGELVENFWRGEYTYVSIQGSRYYVDYADRRKSVLAKQEIMTSLGMQVCESSPYPKWKKNYKLDVASKSFDNSLVISSAENSPSLLQRIKNRLKPKPDVRVLTITGISLRRGRIVYDQNGKLELTLGGADVPMVDTQTRDKIKSHMARQVVRWHEIDPGVRITMAERGSFQPLDWDLFLGGFPSKVAKFVEESLWDFRS